MDPKKINSILKDEELDNVSGGIIPEAKNSNIDLKSDKSFKPPGISESKVTKNDITNLNPKGFI